MLVFFSGRRLKPGRWEQFREAWSPASGEDELPPGAVAVYHARNLKDPDEVISFGIFDMTEDQYRAWRSEADAQENERVDHLSAFVENEPVSGVYEVIETLDE